MIKTEGKEVRGAMRREGSEGGERKVEKEKGKERTTEMYGNDKD